MNGKKQIVIGLTGGIGSGKTVATDALEAAGYCVVDADEISRELFARGTDGERALCAAFPKAQTNGTLDRKKLRALIAADADARKKLNGMTHPAITSEIQRRIRAACGAVVLSAPLLIESGLDVLCDTVVCIHCPQDVRIQRICARDGVILSEAERIIAAQMPDDERNKKADIVITSDMPLREYTNEILKTFNNLTKANDD